MIRTFTTVSAFCLLFAVGFGLSRFLGQVAPIVELSSPANPDSESARSIQSLAADYIRAVPRSVEPCRDFRRCVPQDKLAAILRKSVPSSRTEMISVGTATHALRLWGSEASFDDFQSQLPINSIAPHRHSSQAIWNVLLNGEKYRSLHPKGRPLLAWSDWGISVRYRGQSAEAKQIDPALDCQAHVDKLISVAAETGLPSTYNVIAEGRAGTIADIITDSMLRVHDEQETEFTIKAFLLYLELNATWKNRDGVEAGVDRLLNQIAGNDILSGPCFGTHRCQVLAMALSIDEREPFLTEDLRSAITSALDDVRVRLNRSQRPDGAWGSEWGLSGSELSLEPAAHAPSARIRATGHHLEWICIAPQHLRPDDAVIERAIAYLLATLEPQSAEFFYDHYLPVSHAVRSLVLISGSRPVDVLRRSLMLN